MYAIGLRRGLAGLALLLTGFTGLAPIAPADPPTLLVSGSRIVAAKTKVYAPPPYIFELPSDVTLSQ
jgi:hypothetical protein